MTKPVTKHLWLIASLSIVLHGVVAAIIAANNPNYLFDYALNDNPDAVHYVLLGRNFFELGHYSRMEAEPYAPDVLRPPVYPILAGGLDIVCGGVWGLYLLQSLCTTALACLVYLFAARCFSPRIGLLAGLLFAADPMLILMDFTAMTESLFDLLATAAVLGWLLHLASSCDGETLPPRWWNSPYLLGFILGLAVLTRPSGFYLPAVIVASGLAVAAIKRSRSSVRFLTTSIQLALVTAVCAAPWLARNYVMFGIPRLTTTDTISLCYYAGGSVVALDRGMDRDEAQEWIHQTYGTETVSNTHNHWLSNRSVREIDQQQRQVALTILTGSPVTAVRSTLMGVAKALLGGNSGILAESTGRSFQSPGLDSLLSGHWGTAWQRLRQNDVDFMMSWSIQTFLALLLLAGSVGGLIGMGMDAKHRILLVPIVLLMIYYVMTIGVVGGDAFYRHRSAMVPLMAILTGVWLVRSAEWLLAMVRAPRPETTSLHWDAATR